MSVILEDADEAPRPTVLVLPGLHGSGARHWQSIWERRRRELQRVEQEDWLRPRLGDWAITLERSVRAAPGPVVLVAHSLGCALVAHWARLGSAGRVAGALLVAPADVDALDDPELQSFRPLPLEPLPFEAWVVASDNDPFVSPERARAFASAWGARLVSAGRSGHLNAESGHGPWSNGAELLAQLERAVAVVRGGRRDGLSAPAEEKHHTPRAGARSPQRGG